MTPETLAAWYLLFCEKALAALAEPDPDLDHERRLIREAQEAGL